MIMDIKNTNEALVEAIKGLNREKEILSRGMIGAEQNDCIHPRSRLREIDREIQQLLFYPARLEDGR